MKKFDTSLLRVTPYVLGLILLGTLIFLDISFHDMEWMIIVKILLFLFSGVISLFIFFETFKQDGHFSIFLGNGIITIRFISLIVVIFLIALSILSDPTLISYNKVLEILIYIGFLLIISFFGILIDDTIKNYIEKYYQ